jgi:hypothetical protein
MSRLGRLPGSNDGIAKLACAWSLEADISNGRLR